MDKDHLDIEKKYSTNVVSGLTDKEVKDKQNEFGFNTIGSTKKKNIFKIFFGNFLDWLVMILLIAALVSVIVEPSDFVESLVILVVLIFNSLVDTFQELKTQSSLEELKKLSKTKVKVIRNKVESFIDSENLVVGDIVILKKGDVVPADCLLLECNNLTVDESSITGESVGVLKSIKTSNCLYSTSNILKGNCKCVVTHIGSNSSVGKLAKDLKVEKKKSLLQIKLNELAKLIGIACLVICGVVFLLEIIVNNNYLDALKSSIALAVAAIPEGLLCIVTLVLTLGVSKMTKEKVLVKNVEKVETLGAVNILCTDKTGTLTENQMKLDGVFVNEYELLGNMSKESKELLKFASIAINKDDIDKMEQSILDASKDYAVKNYKVHELVPFDSQSKMLKIIVSFDGKKYLVVKGAYDYISKYAYNSSKKYEIAQEELGMNGLRVIAVGIKEIYDDSISLVGLKILGLIAFKDNLRVGIQESVKNAFKAGIRTVMITGDHITTASAIARESGIIKSLDECISVEELSKLSDDELFSNVTKYSVYSRMTPHDKLRVIKAWQRHGLIVAMTGDGVNDSIALHNADCGIALGSGCDVAKEASDLIILDDNYQSIITGVKLGRQIYQNILKCIKYLLSSNIGEVLTIFVIALVSALSSESYGVALAPIHLLFVNLITDSLPAFGLGLENSSESIMDLQPRDPKEKIINKKIALEILVSGIIISSLTITAFFIGYKTSYIHAMTMAFATLSISQLFHAYNCKTNSSIFSIKTIKNKYLNLSFLIGLFLTIIVIYSPLNNLFKLTTLNTKLLSTVFILSLLNIVFAEIIKNFTKKTPNKRLFYF